MKLTNMALLSTVLLAATMTANVAGVHAADQLEAKTNATFDVTAGELSLEKAPAFTFETTTLNNVVNDKNAQKQTNTDKNQLVVSDYRGYGNTWKLTAAMTPFYLGADQTSASKINASLIMNADNVATTNGQSAAFAAKTLDSGSNGTTIWDNTEAATDGAATATATFTGSTLKVTDSAQVKAGTYTADINWTLADVNTKEING